MTFKLLSTVSLYYHEYLIKSDYSPSLHSYFFSCLFKFSLPGKVPWNSDTSVATVTALYLLPCFTLGLLLVVYCLLFGFVIYCLYHRIGTGIGTSMYWVLDFVQWNDAYIYVCGVCIYVCVWCVYIYVCVCVYTYICMYVYVYRETFSYRFLF